MPKVALLTVAVLTIAVGSSPRVLVAQPSTVRGEVFDSLAGAPLAGVMVQLAPVGDPVRGRTTTTDSLGRFRFDSLSAGRWMIGAYVPFAEALFGDPTAGLFDVPAADTVFIALGLPGPARLRDLLCPGQRGDSTAAVVGLVHDADGRPVDSAKVSIAWSELVLDHGVRIQRRRVPTTVSASGAYLFCGVPGDADISLQATAPAKASGELAVGVAPRTLTRRDIVLGPASTDTAGLARGEARLTGVVRDERGRPLAHAHVVVPGAASSASTDDAGTFHIDSLPSGTWTVEARAIGYEPVRVVADLGPARAADVALRMAKKTEVLERVLVRGRATRESSMLADFLKRKQAGWGSFLTPADVDKRRPFRASDLFWTMPGMHVLPDARGIGGRLRGRGECIPAVYLDGTPVYDGADDIDEIVSGADVMAVEVYRGLETPVEFTSDRHSSCGAVVIWTRR